MTFEWDEKKNKLNKKKHDGISFELAARVFLDQKRIEKIDIEHSTATEERLNVIGLVDRVLFVVFTERKETIRLISARRATREEEEEYYENYDAR